MNTVDIIIPTFNNQEYLQPCLFSLINNRSSEGLFHVYLVNNGHPDSVAWANNPQVTVLQAGDNLGWEGGLKLGLQHSKAPFVCFLNDDTYIPKSSRLWLNELLQHFRDPKVGAVGPASNVVMGMQNIFAQMMFDTYRAKFLIGYCMLVRREALDKVGGVDDTLPGGDDLDLSIRLRDSGYYLIGDRNVFIYHHGFKTGTRVHGDHTQAGGWNSYEFKENTDLALIKKHGFRKWWDCMQGIYEFDTGFGAAKAIPDTEGKIIKGLVKKEDKVILDLGCGPRKTLKRAIGVDFVKKGERVPTLSESEVSDADIEADVSKNLPFEDGSVDVIIARHILEHMLNPIEVLDGWIKKLKSGGRIILALPNEEWHLTIPLNTEHVAAYTPRSAQVLLSIFGLEDIKAVSGENRVSFIVEAKKP